MARLSLNNSRFNVMVALDGVEVTVRQPRANQQVSLHQGAVEIRGDKEYR